MRRYQIEVPGTGYWRRQIKCQAACPVNTDARGYVRAIAEGNDELAYLIARGPNPLASICGRVCGAPCEAACRRGLVIGARSYKSIASILKQGLDSKPLDEHGSAHDPIDHDNVRGPRYYGREVTSC